MVLISAQLYDSAVVFSQVPNGYSVDSRYFFFILLFVASGVGSALRFCPAYKYTGYTCTNCSNSFKIWWRTTGNNDDSHKTTGKNSYCRTTWTDCTVITQWVSKSGYLYPAPELWRRLNGAGRSRTGACLVSAWRRSLTGPTTIVLVADGSMRLVLWLQNFYVLCSKCLCCIPLDS